MKKKLFFCILLLCFLTVIYIIVSMNLTFSNYEDISIRIKNDKYLECSSVNLKDKKKEELLDIINNTRLNIYLKNIIIPSDSTIIAIDKKNSTFFYYIYISDSETLVQIKNKRFYSINDKEVISKLNDFLKELYLENELNHSLQR